MKQDWTEQLRQQLADYEQAAPDGLWDDIAAQLPGAHGNTQPGGAAAPSDGGSRARTVHLRRWLTAAAAVLVAAFVGLGTLYYNKVADQLSGASASAPDNAAPVSASPSAPSATTQPVPQAFDEPTPAARSVRRPPSAGALTANMVTGKPAQPETADTPQAADSPEPSGNGDTPAPPVTATEREPATDPTTILRRTDTPPLSTSTRRDSRPLPPAGRRPRQVPTLSLHGSNLLAQGSSTTVEPVRMAQTYLSRPLYNAMFADVGKNYDDEPLYLNNCSEESRHRAPLNVGLSLRLPLTQRLWIESGVSYSRVSSTLTSRMNQIRMTKDQLLHYIGLPLGAGYTLWQSRHATAYLSVGGTAYMCVAANQEADGKRYDISRDRVQFALSTHAGAEWRLLPPLSLYIEPGLCYYPDNGSAVQNSFKEHPTQFDLRFGLRLSVK